MSAWFAPALGGPAVLAAMGRGLASRRAIARSRARGTGRRIFDLRKFYPRVRDKLADHGEHIIYRVAGLPITIAALASSSSTAAGRLRHAYAHYFWTPDDAGEWFDLGFAMLFWPLLLAIAVIWFTLRNGGFVQRRSGRGRWRQALDQLRLYFTVGMFPPWYYIFSMDGAEMRAHARDFLQRCETKQGVFQILTARRTGDSALNEKDAFARRCVSRQIPHVPVLAVARDGRLSGPVSNADSLPLAGLFLKPVRNRGGKGAERWDHLGGRRYYCETMSLELDGGGLLERLRNHPNGRSCLLQPLTRNHAAIADINNGALATIRILTCLDEAGRPEVIGAVFRMAIGKNRTVDNLHAGGIVADVDLDTGILGRASNLGMNARLGWLDRHPTTGAVIRGRELPDWSDARALAVSAHPTFADHLFVGWDVALTPDGPMLVEGNSGPDLDIMQRSRRRGLADTRFAELIAYHLETPATDNYT